MLNNNGQTLTDRDALVMVICMPKAIHSAIVVFLVAVGWVQAWKDPWLLSFEKNELQHQFTTAPSVSACKPSVREEDCIWKLPSYLAPRRNANFTQMIPRVIFQTWQSYTAAGPHHYKAIMSFVDANPEYAYYLFDDAAASGFMRKFYPENVSIYEQILPGAMKADVWRLAVIYKYGGVYFDSDSHSVTPLRAIIWPNASVVTGVGASNDFHQWALLYTPRHVLIKAALKNAFQRLKILYYSRQAGHVSKTTGPAAFHTAVSEVLNSTRCAIPPNFRTRYKENEIMHFLPDHMCNAEIGVLQVFSGDYLGGNVIFKDYNVENEKNKVSVYYKGAEKRYNTLFKTTIIADMPARRSGNIRDRTKFKQPI